MRARRCRDDAGAAAAAGDRDPCLRSSPFPSSRGVVVGRGGDRRVKGPMEDDNCSPSFTSQADEVPGRKGANPSSSSPGYFSTVIPPASAVIAKDLSHSDFCWTLNKQRNEGGSAGAQRATSDCKSQGCPTKRQVTKNKDEKSVHPNESVESPCFGSSVHYGGRDFYMSSLSMQTTETSESYKTDDGVDWGNRHAADRGEWWQGSLYY